MAQRVTGVGEATEISGAAPCSAVVSGGEAPVHPLASVTVTVYTPAAVTAIEGMVSPVDQRYAANPAVAERTTVSAEQEDSAPYTVIPGAGAGYCDTFTACEVPWHPPFATTTEYVPGVVMVIDSETAPVDHRY